MSIKDLVGIVDVLNFGTGVIKGGCDAFDVDFNYWEYVLWGSTILQSIKKVNKVYNKENFGNYFVEDKFDRCVKYSGFRLVVNGAEMGVGYGIGYGICSLFK